MSFEMLSFILPIKLFNYHWLKRFFILTLFILLFMLIVDKIDCQRQRVATIPGDLVIGALIPVHDAPSLKQTQSRTCGDVREQYGIQRVEAAFQTIDKINKDDKILPNISLGIEIRDECWYSPIALEQSIEFIRDAMAANDEKAASLQSGQSEEPISQSLVLHDSNNTKSVQTRSLFPGIFPPFLALPNSTCPKLSTKKVKNIVGVIGPASSTVTIQVQNLLQLFNIPQVGYSATSRDLSIKNFFKYFLRVVPSDLLQAQLITDLLRTYNWTYISVVYTDGNYGSSLMEVFKGLSQEAGICISNTETVLGSADDKFFDELVINIVKKQSLAKVVACFCEGRTIREILRATKRLNVVGQFLLLGSDGWSDRVDVVKGLEFEAVGGLSVRIYSPYVHEFDTYYFNLNPINNKRNPWFKEFWELRFNCSLFNLTKDVIQQPSGRTFEKQCTGGEDLKQKYKQDSKLAFVKKAIWTMAYGLHNMQRDYCPNTTGLCTNMLPINGSVFLQYLMNVSFVWGNDSVKFDENGDPPGRYDIMNFQKTGNNEYDYVHVGSWVSGGDFNIFHPVQWPSYFDDMIPESVCSKPCVKGQVKNIQSDSVKCCWVCVQCRENQYLLDEHTCEKCPLGWWPNDNLTGCYQIPIEYIHWTNTTSLVAIAIACLGFLMTLFAMIVFIKHNHTPVVKASTRELSYVIMIGMYLCYGTTFTLSAKPSKETCFASRVLPGLSFAIIYAALVTKTNRIARILAGSKKRIITKKLRFMSGTAQVVITWILISIELAIIVVLLVKEPADKVLAYPSIDRVQLICNTTPLGIIAPLGFDFFLIAMCTVYAIKTRNVPENFNEAKFIGFTMYTTLVIWIAFVPIYFGSNSKVITLCLCTSFSAIVALVLLFFPKIYIILFKPEKNNRSYFTTAKNVRCHIGFVPTMGVSRHSSHSTSEFSMESPRNHSLDVHHKREPGGIHHQLHPADKKDINKRKPTLNLFQRFRTSKQDKIAANVQQHIRAVRAAEALDRQTRVRRTNFAKLPPQRSSSSGDDDASGGGDQHKMRLVTMLRQTYGNEVEKIPGFIEFAQNAKQECRRTFVDSSAQTSYDLLETWFPVLRKRIIQSENRIDNEEENGPSKLEQNLKKFTFAKVHGHEGKKPAAHASINYAFDQHNEDVKESLLKTSKFDMSFIPSNNSDKLLTKTTPTEQSSPKDMNKRKIGSMGKAVSSEESLLSGGSLVIEESASSGGESSPGSGIYKNIIINLSNIIPSSEILCSENQINKHDEDSTKLQANQANSKAKKHQ